MTDEERKLIEAAQPTETLVMGLESALDGLRACTESGAKAVAHVHEEGAMVVVLWHPDESDGSPGGEEFVYVRDAIADVSDWLDTLPTRRPSDDEA